MTVVTRFAPSPTGLLHLGHAYAAIQAHDHARAKGGRFLLRIEDIDGTRSREPFVAGILDDLAWLGLSWDGPVVRQSQRLALYDAALARLRAAGLLYPCFCTRADIAREIAESASAGPLRQLGRPAGEQVLQHREGQGDRRHRAAGQVDHPGEEVPPEVALAQRRERPPVPSHLSASSKSRGV